MPSARRIAVYDGVQWCVINMDGGGGTGNHGSLFGLELDHHLQYAPIHVIGPGDPDPVEHRRKGQIVVRTGAASPDGLDFLQTQGGQMTGPLYLSGMPSNSLEAASKGYVDSLLGDGARGDATYTHSQESLSLLWVVVHNLGKRPAVSIVDGGGAEVHADVTYVDENRLSIRFDYPMTGTAVCN